LFLGAARDEAEAKPIPSRRFVLSFLTRPLSAKEIAQTRTDSMEGESSAFFAQCSQCYLPCFTCQQNYHYNSEQFWWNCMVLQDIHLEKCHNLTQDLLPGALTTDATYGDQLNALHESAETDKAVTEPTHQRTASPLRHSVTCFLFI
jgi:hypothetical protein